MPAVKFPPLKYIKFYCEWLADANQSQAGFAAVDAVTGLKLIEGGLHKETIAFVALAAVPIQVILPAVLR